MGKLGKTIYYIEKETPPGAVCRFPEYGGEVKVELDIDEPFKDPIGHLFKNING